MNIKNKSRKNAGETSNVVANSVRIKTLSSKLLKCIENDNKFLYPLLRQLCHVIRIFKLKYRRIDEKTMSVATGLEGDGHYATI